MPTQVVNRIAHAAGNYWAFPCRRLAVSYSLNLNPDRNRLRFNNAAVLHTANRIGAFHAPYVLFEKVSGFFEPIHRPAHLTIWSTLKHGVEQIDICQIGDSFCIIRFVDELVVQQKFCREKGLIMEKKNIESEDADDGLPDVLKTALGARYGNVPDVPSEIDRVILADARRHFEKHGPATQRTSRRQRALAWRWTAIGSTMAAACVLFFAMRPQQPNPDKSLAAKSSSDSASFNLSSDVDLNGRVDILDAFAMAREMRDGSSKFRDINRDGRFDQLDIDVVAREAVKL